MGAVLVSHGTEWHAVCDADFEYRDARIVCRTLGFEDGKVYLQAACYLLLVCSQYFQFISFSPIYMTFTCVDLFMTKLRTVHKHLFF